MAFGCTVVDVPHKGTGFASTPESISTSLRNEGGRAAAGLDCCESNGGVDLTVDAGDHCSANDREHGSRVDSSGGTMPVLRGVAALFASPGR